MNEHKGFNPEYCYLENPEILAMQLLVDTIIGEKKYRKRNLAMLQKKLDIFYAQCTSTTNSQALPGFIAFIKDTQKFLDKGGMNLGRSAIDGVINAVRQRIIADGLDSEWDAEGNPRLF
ncbi:MAG: hypothetical protein G01um101425_733 [Candidatus Peregrinibacteria bacterium Gr01-1014_25]|nr:MAG: hypothetical protein G01um101425_733 [Candidatus Peregrinibacteria bacterium Gr01-1014_25]